MKEDIIAVGNVADALGQEGVLDFHLFEPDRPLLARNLGKLRDFVDQLALGRPAHREGKARPERQPVKHRGEWEADQRSRKRAAEDDDERVRIREHPQVAPHENEGDQHDPAGKEPKAGCNVH
jgi:hypothetical protein